MSDGTLVRIQTYTEESGSGGVQADSSFCGDLGKRECTLALLLIYTESDEVPLMLSMANGGCFQSILCTLPLG